MSDVRNTDEPTMPSTGYSPPFHGGPQQGAVPAQGGPALSPSTQRRGSAVPLLIVAGISSLVGIFLAIPAAILGIIAVAHRGDSPSRSAKFTRWGWIAYAIGMTLTGVAAAILIGFATYAASGNN